ncbi:sterol desaturase family protein [Methylovulum psychrotolerans]|jgi:sterol desaturase/sphingolipid hydroxylase (fatty acid hydroxylase superfamily)|uniref:sterol desaturase family protein n=1 Tax=Methylovulum psychrotolerans TaxID=1704499 RepID=UPI001BFF0A9E|nr:sterol desaturase family protein [Methylovulum psychrotolerans]MBT9098059.1 sterol desaturase family protein [Methylovulum psychrotolerans]
MSPAESPALLAEASQQASLLFNEVLFGLAMLAFAVLMVMEHIQPYRKFTNKISKESFVTNTTAFLFNNIILTALRASSLFFIAQRFSGFGLLSEMANGPLKWLLSFVLFDFSIYLWHLVSHKYEWLWRFHKVHHSDKSFNVSTGFRFHVFDLFLEILYKCLFVMIIGVDAYVVLAIEIIELFFIFFHHANLAFKYENLISQFIITPSLHRVHHSALRKEHDSNYGIVLSGWDKLFGTRKELVPEKIGLDTIVAENFLQLFFLAFVTERHIRRLLQIIPKGKK